eukprot:TRINITY_DN9946_c1_g1_i2.p1 TRINITY_DN9946_c1_g1~~TRINITY_DN9946_c1_g1_i2.p1  ORF type:complete len:954 (+),score=151.13 TRINITY_DN9946_c1_g1_i2:98-2959(+)
MPMFRDPPLEFAAVDRQRQAAAAGARGGPAAAVGAFAACAASGSLAFALSCIVVTPGAAAVAAAAAATIASSTVGSVLVAWLDRGLCRLEGALAAQARDLAAELKDWHPEGSGRGSGPPPPGDCCSIERQASESPPAPAPRAGCLQLPSIRRQMLAVTALGELIGRLKEVAQDAQVRERRVQQFVASTSHDIRTPLHGIIGLVELSLPGATAEARGLLQQVVSEGQRLQVLLNDILDLSRLQAGAMTVVMRPIHIWKPVKECCELFAEHTARTKTVGLNVSPTLHGELLENAGTVTAVRALADRHRLMQVTTNLLSNAFKHARSSVTVRCCCYRRAQMFDALSAQLVDWLGGPRDSTAASTGALPPLAPGDPPTGPHYVFVCFVDDGPGVPADAIESIWRPFEQARPSRDATVGAGLGLSICASLMQLMGGCIGCVSQPGSGSCFYVGLRITTDELSEVDMSLATCTPPESTPARSSVFQCTPLGVPAPARKQLVLVVDDTALSRLVARRFLERSGCAVIEASTGDKCLTILKERAAQKGHVPDLVLLDWEMPGMSGLEVAAAIREYPDPEVRNVPVVCASGHSTAGDGMRAVAAGCDAFLPKPFTAAALNRTIAPFLFMEVSVAGSVSVPSAGRGPTTPLKEGSPRSSTCNVWPSDGPISVQRDSHSLTSVRRSLAVAEEESIVLRARLSPSPSQQTCMHIGSSTGTATGSTRSLGSRTHSTGSHSRSPLTQIPGVGSSSTLFCPTGPDSPEQRVPRLGSLRSGTLDPGAGNPRLTAGQVDLLESGQAAAERRRQRPPLAQRARGSRADGRLQPTAIPSASVGDAAAGEAAEAMPSPEIPGPPQTGLLTAILPSTGSTDSDADSPTMCSHQSERRSGGSRHSRRDNAPEEDRSASPAERRNDEARSGGASEGAPRSLSGTDIIVRQATVPTQPSQATLLSPPLFDGDDAQDE